MHQPTPSRNTFALALYEVSQWTMERTIGNLGGEIRLYSDLHANLSQKVIECA